MKRFILLLMLASPAAANTITPNFTQGSMQSTTTTTVDIDRTVTTNIYGGDYDSWSGTNVTPSGAVNDSSTTYSVTNAGEQFQLEIVTRSAGVVENIVVDEVITQESTTTSLSIFSQ
jgi:hypothetical protein|tara:strand:+ start:864 stop:1214 length:351 start_codon:yes stop_codon:yes gene_type:complete